MKHIMFFLVCFWVHAGICGTLEKGRTEVVVAADAPEATRLAGTVMTNFLSRIFGETVPLVSARSGCRTPVFLGAGACGAVLRTRDFSQDEFEIRSQADAIWIAGRDDARTNVFSLCFWGEKSAWQPLFERATLFGVYEFLERFAGVRFYFPGKLGTIVPSAVRLSVPEGGFRVRPVFSVRKYGTGDGVVAPEVCEGGDQVAAKRTQYLRLRMETSYIPCCHGLNKFRYLDRFGTSHPEYFALGANGARSTTRGGTGHSGQLCFSSDINEVIYQDVKAYLTGQDAKTRGLPSWGRNVSGRYVDVMAQDGMGKCRCEACQGKYDPKAGSGYASELVWGNTVRMANRLKDEGIPGTLTQMAYPPYRTIPKTVRIPDNVAVMVAETGPWALQTADKHRRDTDEVVAWTKFLGRKVWIWTYPRKGAFITFPGIPQMAPHAWGNYYKELAPYIFGSYAESESDHWIFNYLNYYVFSRVCWDPEVDIDAILAEHDKLMFGAAADEMRTFYDALESCWTRRIVARATDSNLGCEIVPPDAETVWNEVYSAAVLSEWGALFERAATKVRTDSTEAKRIAFFRREYLERLGAARAAFLSQREKVAALRHEAVPTNVLELRKLSRRVSDRDLVKTQVAVWREKDQMKVRYRCEEPFMAARAAVRGRAHDASEIRGDDGVEFFLNPSGDRRHYLHFFVNCHGDLLDARGVRRGVQITYVPGWESGATVTAVDGQGEWCLEISIPMDAIDGGVTDAFTANFCRNRKLNGKAGSCFYLWGPYAEGYYDALNYGTLVFPSEKRESAGASVPSDILTAKGELDEIRGHVQGLACTEEAIYAAHKAGIFKLDWSGHVLKHVRGPVHIGDICFHEGRVYAPIIRYGNRPDGMGGIIKVYDADLNPVSEHKFKDGISSLVFFKGRFYGGLVEDKARHGVNRIAIYDRDLNLVEIRPFDYGEETLYGAQVLAVQGDRLRMFFYGGVNTVLCDENLDVLSKGRYNGAEGFVRVPASRTGGEEVYLTVSSVGNCHKWKPVTNPAQVRFSFVRPVGDVFQ